MQTNLSDLVVQCSACSVGHSAGYRCSGVRKADRNASFYPARTFAQTVAGKVTR